MRTVSNVLLLFAYSVQSRVCFFWSVSLLLDAWMSCSLGQTTWLLWLYPLVFGTKLADTICYSIWPFHWWNGILSEGNVIKMNRTLKIWELFDMGQTTYEVSAFHWFLVHIWLQWCIFKYYQLFRNMDQLCCRNNVQSGVKDVQSGSFQYVFHPLLCWWKIKTHQLFSLLSILNA